MKTKNQFFIISLSTIILLSINTNTSGQGGYFKGKVTLKDGTELQGFIKDASDAKNTTYCSFKEDIKGNEIKYTPEEVQGYQIEDRKIYTSYKIKTAQGDSVTRLLQTLVGGEMNLFFLREGGTNHFYIKYPGKALTEIIGETLVKMNGINYATQGNFKNELKAAFVKCPQPVENLHFEQDRLLNSVKKYNECSNVKNQTFAYHRPKNNFYIGVKAGNSLLNIDDYYSGYATYYSNQATSTSMGVSFITQVNQINKRAHLEFDVLLTKTKFVHVEYSSEVPIYFESIQLPLFMQYEILPTKLSPYILGGAFLNLPYSQPTVGGKLTAEEIGSKDTGVLYGLGLKYQHRSGFIYMEGKGQTIHHSPLNSKESIVGNYITISLGLALKL